MTDSISRRDALKALGVAGAASLISSTPAAGALADTSRSETSVTAGATDAPPAILPLVSTSEVFVPPRGRAYTKFSFDFPEPSVPFDGLRFGFLVFTRENTYALDQSKMTVEQTRDGLRITSTGFTWAGGQEHASGRLVADLHKNGDALEWSIVAEMAQPIKTVTTVIRGVPRGKLSAGGDFFDPQDNEILFGYPFGGGDLFGPGDAGGISTPLVMLREAEGKYVALSSLDDRVRTKRFYFQPGESAYRVEAIHEVEGWKSEPHVEVPTWRLARVQSPEAALTSHYDHLARAYHFPTWDTRPDVPEWMRRTALVMTLHGQHYTGYIFNDFTRMLEILRWTAAQIPAERVLVFISAWDGRYYWDYPRYEMPARMGGEAAFRKLITEGKSLGFRFMPMFGMNAANREQPVYSRFADAATSKIDGDVMDLNWVDWDNDRHQDGWLSYMNLGVASWRTWLTSRIAEMIERYGVDAYFLDIAGGWVNNPKADMHEGMRTMVTELRSRYPHVLCCGEMHYDAMLEFIPLYHAGGGGLARTYIQRHAKFFQHLSHPAPGRGSTGVHEAGFGRFDPATLSLSDSAIPTLNVVDDTFAKYRDVMAAVMKRAKERAGLP